MFQNGQKIFGRIKTEQLVAIGPACSKAGAKAVNAHPPTSLAIMLRRHSTSAQLHMYNFRAGIPCLFELW